MKSFWNRGSEHGIRAASRVAFNSSHSWWYWLGVAGLILLADHVIKQQVEASMPYGASYHITFFFNLVHGHNTGAAFGFLAEAGGWQRYVFSALGIIVSVVLGWLLRRGVKNRLEATAYMLIMAGAMGNIVDRVTRGFVVDYLDFHLQGWHWPAFNLADTAITCGAVCMVLAEIWRPRQASTPRLPGS